MSETTAAVDTAPTTQTFSIDYVRELRNENKSFRQKAQELESALHTAQQSAQKVTDEHGAKIASVEQAAKDRVIRAELKAHALRAGMIDPDGLKLLDITKVTMTDDGELEGVDSLLKQAKDTKPYLFGVTNNTTSTSQAPKPAEVKSKSAMEMSDDELKVFEKQHGIVTHTA